jgi:hypothetical protein
VDHMNPLPDISAGRNGGNPTSHTPALNVTAAAAPFQA